MPVPGERRPDRAGSDSHVDKSRLVKKLGPIDPRFRKMSWERWRRCSQNRRIKALTSRSECASWSESPLRWSSRGRPGDRDLEINRLLKVTAEWVGHDPVAAIISRNGGRFHRDGDIDRIAGRHISIQKDLLRGAKGVAAVVAQQIVDRPGRGARIFQGPGDDEVLPWCKDGPIRYGLGDPFCQVIGRCSWRPATLRARRGGG